MMRSGSETHTLQIDVLSQVAVSIMAQPDRSGKVSRVDTKSERGGGVEGKEASASRSSGDSSLAASCCAGRGKRQRCAPSCLVSATPFLECQKLEVVRIPMPRGRTGYDESRLT